MNLGEYAASQANIFQLIADVPIDATQTRQLYFTTEANRDTYFSSKVVAAGSNTNFKFIRKNRAIKVQTHENTIENCNYMRFKNTGGMWWYAFITNIEYVNPNTSMVYFVIDSYQTFFLQATFKECDISREHTANVTLWGNTVAESVDYGDYTIYQTQIIPFNVSKYLIVSTIDLAVSGRDSNGNPYIEGAMGGIYNNAPSAVNIYLCDTMDILKRVVTALTNYPWVAQNIVGVYGIPSEMAQGVVTVNTNIHGVTVKEIAQTPNAFSFTQGIANWVTKFPSYNAKKLLTYPYSFIEIVTPDGNTAIFKPQLINPADDTLSLSFRMIFNPTVQWEVKVMRYDGSANTDWQFQTLNCIDQPSYPIQNNQYFAQKQSMIAQYNLTRRQNAENLRIGEQYANTNLMLSEAHHAIDLAGHAMGILDPTSWMQGGVTGHITGAGHTAISMAQDYVGTQQQIETANRLEQQAAERDRQKIDQNQTGISLSGRENAGAMPINIAAGTNNLIIRFWTVVAEFREKLEQYFSAFGYRSMRIGTPNFQNGRRYYYIRCNSVNIYGDIPNVYLNELQNIFLDGITLWKDHENVGVYGNN